MQEIINYFVDAISAFFSSSGSFFSDIIGFVIKMFIAAQIGSFLEFVIMTKIKYKTTRLFIFVALTILSVFLYGSFYDRFRKSENYFKFAGVERSASTQEIRRTYRRYAATNHPDKVSSMNRKKFSEITAIFNFLSDPDLRWNYDRFNIVAQDKFIDFWEFGFQIFNICLSYFQWVAFSCAIFAPRKGINDKSKCILTLLMCFIYSIYNATIRTKGLKDPIDMIFPQKTIYERNELIVSFIPIQLNLARLWFSLFSRIQANDLALSFTIIDINLEEIKKQDNHEEIGKTITTYRKIIDDIKYHIFSQFGMNQRETRIKLAEVKYSKRKSTNKPNAKSPSDFMGEKDKRIYESGPYYGNPDDESENWEDEEKIMDENKTSKNKKTANKPSSHQQGTPSEGMNEFNQNGPPSYSVYDLAMWVFKGGFSILKSLAIFHCIYYGMVYLASR